MVTSQQTQRIPAPVVEVSDNQEIVGALNDLLEMTIDGKKGYQEAANHVKNDVLNLLFERHSAEREIFARQLASLISGRSGKPATQGNLEATIHRVWMGLKSLLSSGDELTLINEAIRGEDAALDTYTDVLSYDLTRNERKIIHSQYEDIERSRQQLMQLKADRYT